MPLIPKCKERVGHRLFVLPYYGYGWNRQDGLKSPATLLDTLGPEPFRLGLDELIADGERLVGLSGTINEQEHQFDNYWCGCLLRNPDECDLTTQPGHYMVWIAPTKLQVDPAPAKALYEWVTFDKSVFCLCGFGMVAESVDWLQDIYERTLNSRRLAKEQ